MRDWRIFLLLCVLLWGSVNAFALRCASPGLAPESRCTRVLDNGVSRDRYFKPQIGRFWTADTYEGSRVLEGYGRLQTGEIACSSPMMLPAPDWCREGLNRLPLINSIRQKLYWVNLEDQIMLHSSDSILQILVISIHLSQEP